MKRLLSALGWAALLAGILIGCKTHTSAESTQSYLKRLKADRGMASQYRARCQLGCQGRQTVCSTGCLEQPPRGEPRGLCQCLRSWGRLLRLS